MRFSLGGNSTDVGSSLASPNNRSRLSRVLLEQEAYHRGGESVMNAAAYESVLHLADSLSHEEKLRLIRELTALTEGSKEKPGPEKDRSILELSGLGAEIWSGIDAQEYVRNERSSWSG